MTDFLPDNFRALIRISLGLQPHFDHLLTEGEWRALYEEAQRQSLLGVLFEGVRTEMAWQRLEDDLPGVIYDWMAEMLYLEQQNGLADAAVAKVYARLRAEGFRACILKGQGVARYYPEPARRQCGDIDVWVDAPPRRVLAFVRRFVPRPHPVYHNVACPMPEFEEIELHFRPSWLYNPLRNRRLQRWFDACRAEQFAREQPFGGGAACFPTLRFDRVYILLHIYRHVFAEGIGLRQLLDYYYILRQGCSEAEREEALSVFRRLGLLPFVAALMFIMQDLFGLEERFLLLPPDAERGAFLLAEVAQAGNFGLYDKRIDRAARGSAAAFFRHLRRNLAFFSQYPSEVFWTPWWKIWHLFWRKAHGHWLV
ncbi:MAG: nucleotidyltransferase family protein [Bacteroidales bacterium]|nr:nucleotidyltransferase family protein [Bacteroidales bacterium]